MTKANNEKDNIAAILSSADRQNFQSKINGDFVLSLLRNYIDFFQVEDNGQYVIREHVNPKDKLLPFKEIIENLDKNNIFRNGLFIQKSEVPNDPVYGKFDPVKHAAYYDVVTTATDLIIDTIEFCYKQNPNLIKNLSDQQLSQIRKLMETTSQIALDDHSFMFYQSMRVHALKRGLEFFQYLEKEAVARRIDNAGMSLEDLANMHAPYQKNFKNIFLSSAGQLTRVKSNEAHKPAISNVQNMLSYMDNESQMILSFILTWKKNPDKNFFNTNIQLPDGTIKNFFEIKNLLPLLVLMEENLDKDERSKFQASLKNSALSYVSRKYPTEYKSLQLGLPDSAISGNKKFPASIGIEIETTDAEESALTYVLGTMFSVNFDADASVTDIKTPTHPQREYTSGIIRTELDLQRFLFFTRLSANKVNKSCGMHVHFGSLPFLQVQSLEFELHALEQQINLLKQQGQNLSAIESEYKNKKASIEKSRAKLKLNIAQKASESMCLSILQDKITAFPSDEKYIEFAQRAELACMKAIMLSFGSLEPHLRGILRDGNLWDGKALWSQSLDFQNSEDKPANIIKAKNYSDVWSVVNDGKTVPSRFTRTHALNIESLMRHSTIEDRAHEGTVSPATINAFVKLHLRMVSMIQQKFVDSKISANTDFTDLDYSKLVITPAETSALMTLYIAEKDKTINPSNTAKNIYNQSNKIFEFTKHPHDFKNVKTAQGLANVINGVAGKSSIDVAMLEAILNIVDKDYTVDKSTLTYSARKNFKTKLESLFVAQKPGSSYIDSLVPIRSGITRQPNNLTIMHN